jgi:hypothetical protein
MHTAVPYIRGQLSRTKLYAYTWFKSTETNKNENVTYKGQNAAYKDEDVTYKGENVAYKDEDVTNKGEDVTYKGENVRYKDEDVTYKGENGTYKDESTAFRNTTHLEIAIHIMRTVPYIITKITYITEMFLH